MAHISNNGSDASGRLWYCLRTQVKREHIAATFLTQIEGVEPYCPRISQVRKTRAGKKRFTEALFPSYLFARFSYEEKLRHVVHTQGVSGIVEHGQTKAIPAHIIDELKESIPNDVLVQNDPSLQPGTEIEFISGTLKGLNGQVLVNLPSRERVNILLEFLGRDLEVEANINDIIVAKEL